MLRLVVSLLLLVALTAEARLPLQRMQRVLVSGSDYIRLDDWAESAGFEMKWSKSSGVVTLSSQAGHLALTIDSRRAEICGVNVWLSMPVVNRSGTALLSLVDAATTVEPILFPRKAKTPLRTVCIDPGHGGKDKGEISGHNYEKIYTLLLARDVADLLRKAGLNVMLTRDSDYFVELPERTQKARREGADLFVSLHYNSAENYIRGLEVYCLAPAGVNSSNEGGGRSPRLPEAGNIHDSQNALLAWEVDKAVTSNTPLEDRGMKRSRFEVLREASMPAILIEGGFMSNPSDARNIYDPAFRKRMARAIVEGIIAYKKAVEHAS